MKTTDELLLAKFATIYTVGNFIIAVDGYKLITFAIPSESSSPPDLSELENFHVYSGWIHAAPSGCFLSNLLYRSLLSFIGYRASGIFQMTPREQFLFSLRIASDLGHILSTIIST